MVSVRRKKSSSFSSTERTLVYATGLVFTTYIFLTVKTFQKLPPIPSIEDVIGLGQSFTISSLKNTNSQVSDSFAIENLAEETLFPQSIDFGKKGDETSSPISDQLEKIVHPAAELLPSLDIKDMVVPKFYSPPIFEQYGGIRSYLGNGTRPMTLSEAKTIGSFVNDENDNNNPLETIFIAIASYRDFQCQQTIESILTRATHPQRIRVAVVDQLDFDNDTPCSEPEVPCAQNPDQVLCKYKNQIDFFEMDAAFAVGPVFARHLGHRMYRGEYFAAQCDAHVDFIKDWDVKIIEAWKSAKNEMAVLSTYLSDIHGAMDEEGNLKVFSRPIMCKSDFEGYGATKHLRHGQQPEGETRIKGEPTIEPFWAAGFSFSRGHFIVNVPYDQHLPWVFQGEEISIGLRGFTYGYDYYAPQHSVCFHYYANADPTGKRSKIHLFWEHSSEFGKGGNVVEKKGMKRLNGILNMNPPQIKDDEWLHDDEHFYGLGSVRTTQKFFETFGIDIKKQTTEDHLCKFVGMRMQKKWKPHLRKDTMGIDYDGIHVKFRDPDVYGFNF